MPEKWGKENRQKGTTLKTVHYLRRRRKGNLKHSEGFTKEIGG
jgi:hypothetical protein